MSGSGGACNGLTHVVAFERIKERQKSTLDVEGVSVAVIYTMVVSSQGFGCTVTQETGFQCEQKKAGPFQ